MAELPATPQSPLDPKERRVKGLGLVIVLIIDLGRTLPCILQSLPLRGNREFRLRNLSTIWACGI